MIKVSSAFGIEPAWSRGGRELVYRTGPAAEQFMAVGVSTAPKLSVSSPRPLFTTDQVAAGQFDRVRDYDVSADGQEFVGLREKTTPTPDRRLVIVTDWASSQPR